MGRSVRIEAQPEGDDEEAWRADGREVVFVLNPIEDKHDGLLYPIPISDEDAALIVNVPEDIAALIAKVERLAPSSARTPE